MNIRELAAKIWATMGETCPELVETLESAAGGVTGAMTTEEQEALCVLVAWFLRKRCEEHPGFIEDFAAGVTMGLDMTAPTELGSVESQA